MTHVDVRDGQPGGTLTLVISSQPPYARGRISRTASGLSACWREGLSMLVTQAPQPSRAEAALSDLYCLDRDAFEPGPEGR